MVVLSIVVAVFAGFANAATLIPGTRITLEVPPEFELASDFTGILWAAAGSSVLVAELPTAAQQMQAGLTKETLASRGIALAKRETVTAGIGPAVLLEATQSAQGVEVQKWILVGGDAKNTVMVTATVPAPLAEKIGPIVRDVLLGARWDPSLPTNVAGAFAFRFDESRDLKIARNLGSAIVFTQDGNEQMASPLGPALVISRSTSAEPIIDLSVFAKRRLGETRTVNGAEVREETTIEVAGMPAHELVASGTAKNGASVVVYQLVGYDGTNLVFVQAFVEPGLEARYLPQFREIAHSLRPR